MISVRAEGGPPVLVGNTEVLGPIYFMFFILVCFSYTLQACYGTILFER